jgi:hypothetical protein
MTGKIMWKIRYGWEDSIKMYFKEVWCEGLDQFTWLRIPTGNTDKGSSPQS